MDETWSMEETASLSHVDEKIEAMHRNAEKKLMRLRCRSVGAESNDKE